MNEKMIKIDNIVKRYGSFVALDHLKLEIREGEIFGLLGPNGSGKTTTISCLLALLRYDKGEIDIFGEKMTPDSYELKKIIGIVPQEIAVFDELTVRQNIDYFCGLYINDRKKRKKLVDKAIDFVGLEKYIKMYPRQLSGGLLRRLNIACGIAHEPKIIIMDEPTVAVDPQSRNSILEGIKRLNKNGATIIYTSHYMEEVEQICTRIAIMDKGRNLALGTKDELKAMIDLGETIQMEVMELSEEVSDAIRTLPHVIGVSYDKGLLKVRFSKGKHNLLRLLDLLKEKEIAFGNVHSELPTLNDVFLEITGKELRD